MDKQIEDALKSFITNDLMSWDELADRVLELEDLLEDLLAYMAGGVWHYEQSPDMVIKAALKKEG